MKRIIVFLFFVVLAIIPVSVNAKDARINSYDVDVYINELGSADIVEHIKLSSVSSFKVQNNYIDCNGLNKILYVGLDNDLYGSDLYMTHLKDKAVIIDKNNEPIPFETNETTVGEEYVISNVDEVYIKYTLDDAVVVHSDKAEFYYNFFRNKFNLDVDNSVINIHLPKKSAYIKAFDYRPFSDIKTTNNLVTFKYSGNTNTRDVNIRVLFDTNMIKTTRIINHGIGYSVEKSINDNLTRNIVYYICIILTILFCLNFVRIVILVILKYGKNKKYKVEPSLDETIVNKYDYAGINYLINKDITVDALLAEIVSLINNYKLDVIRDENGEYYLARGNSDNRTITVNEKYILDLLLEVIDKKFNAPVDMVSFVKVKQFCEDNSSVSSFILNFNVWKTIQVKNAREYRFMVGNEYYFSLRNSMYFSYVLLALNIVAQTYFALGIVAFIPVTLLTNVMLKLTKRDQNAEDAYKQTLVLEGGIRILGPNTTDPYRWDLFLIDSIAMGNGAEVEQIIKNKINNNTLVEHYNSRIIDIYRMYPDFSIVQYFENVFRSSYKKSFFIYTKKGNNRL